MCTSHTWTTRALAVQEVSNRDGLPTGFYSVEEAKACSCGARGACAVPGTRARSPREAQAKYRAAGGKGEFR